MLFGYFTFFVALVISAVAEYYSIIGLTSIFSAAYWPVVIMGAALGVGKITATMWLKLNWDRATWTYKLYLVPAVVFLMFLTSMGIFGFLSKAHSDLGLVTGEIASKIAIYDEKIKIANENIDTNRKALKQLDAAVDQVMERTTNEQGAIKSVAIRKSQLKERQRLLNEIVAEQKIIGQMSAERAPIAAEIRKVEAEVGPIKYIAALIYGNNLDSNLLESAVRWVIILIVLVFDPLALCLMLAAQQTLRWVKEDRKLAQENKTIEKPASEEIAKPNYEPDDGPLTNEQVDQLKSTVEQFEETKQEQTKQESDDQAKENLEIEEFFKNGRRIAQMLDKNKVENRVSQNSVLQDPQVTNLKSNVEVLPLLLPLNEIKTTSNEPYYLKKVEWENMTLLSPSVYMLTEHITQPTIIDAANVKINLSETIETIETKTVITNETAPAAKLNLPQPPEAVPPKAKEVIQVPETIDRRKFSSMDSGLTADNADSIGNNVKAHFGITFPLTPDRGELFLRVDYLPTRLFKFNGSKWIEVDKTMTDSYVYNTEYIKFMIKEIDDGRLDPDEISPSERDQIADFLANDEQTRNTP